MKALIKRYLNYNHWANAQYMESLISSNITNEKLHWQMSHILNAQQVWQQRLEGKPLKYQPFEVHAASKWAEIEQELYGEALRLLSELDLEATIVYHSTSGKQYQDQVKDIFLHFIDHCSYHRGQMALKYRELDMEPLKTNLIHWSRMGGE